MHTQASWGRGIVCSLYLLGLLLAGLVLFTLLDKVEELWLICRSSERDKKRVENPSTCKCKEDEDVSFVRSLVGKGRTLLEQGVLELERGRHNLGEPERLHWGDEGRGRGEVGEPGGGEGHCALCI